MLNSSWSQSKPEGAQGIVRKVMATCLTALRAWETKIHVVIENPNTTQRLKGK
jgi:hypothetical protein